MLKLNKFPLLFPWKHNKTKIMAEDATDGAVAEVVVVPNEELRPCNVCGRTFLPRSLATHSRVCERNATRKRKVFDSLKQRVEGTDLAPFHQKTYLKKTDAAIVTSTTTDAARPSKWKEKHLELVNAIRAAKGASTMPSPPKRSSTTLGTPTHERCPSCERQFGPKAYDRHVEWCKERRTTIHKSPASVVMAKERLEARTKYKVPPLNKSKRALTREKYSPQMSRTESIASMKSSSSCLLDRSPSVRKSKSVLYPRKSIDKIEQNEPKPENVEKNVGDSIPITKKNPHEPVKSSHAKRTLPSSKINSIAVNDGVGGLTVSSLDAKKMTTWKETTNAPKTEPSPTPTCRSDDVRRGPKIITGKSPRKPSSKIAKITKTNPIKKADVVLEKHKVTPDVGKMTVHLENVATGFCFESGVNLRTPPGDEDEFRLKSTSSKCVGCDESCFAESDSNPLVEFDATANSNVAVEELECDYFKKCESNEIDEGCLENDVYDVEYYNRQVADLRDKLLSVDASKRTLSVEIASEGSNKEIAVGKLIDLNDEDVRCEHSQRAVNPEVVLSNSEVASINPEVISINSEIVSIKHEVVSIKHEVVSINHEVVPINYEAVPINHEVVPTNHEAVPINHEAVPINHEALPINHEAVLINHEVVPTNHQAVPINHEAVPINHEAVPINHEVVPTNHEAVPINHEGNETKKPTSCVDGLSCIDRYKFDKKRMYCEKFLERNRLVDYACFEGAQGKNIEIESPCGDHVGKCAIDFPLEISQSKEDEEIEFKNPAYYDSLDDSVSSDDFKDDLTSNVSPPTADKMLHWRKTNYFSDCESVVDGYENEHSLALSAARIEREIRKCCSDICLHKSSESSFVSFTDVDLKKFSSDECTNIRDEIDKLTTDQILEIAAEEFVSSLKEPILFGNDAVTSTPVSHKKNAPPLTDIVPSKRRKLDENAVDSLIKNIERIKMRKVDDLLEIPQTSEERFKDMVQKGENLLNHQANGSIDGFETKRILSTIDEASSNASTVLPRIAEENRRKPRIRSSSEDSRTPRTRPVSNTSSNVSPRLLHVIRSVLNPELTVTPRELYSMEEDLVRVSRVHCRKMLKMSRQVLDEILDKEPLRLPKIAQKDTIERRKSPSKNVKLPEIKQKIGVNEGERKAYFKFAMPFANSLKGIVKSADSKREKSDVDVDVVR